MKRDIVVIGASAGGVSALRELCAALPADLPAIVGVVIHRSPWEHSDIPMIYGWDGRIRVREARRHDTLETGTAYFAPPDHHMLFSDAVIELSRGPEVHFARPAVDCLFLSAATAFQNRVVGILLTGAGSDGARGLAYIKSRGGLTLVQHPREAEHPTMPLSGIREDRPIAVSLSELPSILQAVVRGESIEVDETGAGEGLNRSRWVSHVQSNLPGGSPIY